MARILTRPMFRKGGLSQETGIMSGLDRKGYARGSYAPRVGYWTGSPPPGTVLGQGFTMTPSGSSPIGTASRFYPPTAQSGSQITSEAVKKLSKTRKGLEYLKNLLKKSPNLAKRLTGRVPLTLSQSAAAGPVAGMIAPTLAGAGIGYGIGKTADILTRAYDTPEAYALRKQIMKEDPYTFDETNMEVGDAIARIEAADVGEKPGLFPRGGIEKWRKDRGLDPETGEKIVPKKEKPDLTTNNDLDIKATGDMESDLMRAYKEYAPIFEKELGVSPEDTKKQLWMQLAKFGTGLMAQPGGDLVGAVGKAAATPLEGAGETVKDVSTAKRQAKLLAMQTALRDVAPGDIAKKAKDVKKLLGLKGKEGDKQAFNIVNKWLSNDRTYRAEELKSYRKTAETLNVNAEGYLESMEELKEKHPKLVSKLGRTTKKLPDMEDLEDDAVKGEYYINDEGKIYRYNPDSDPPLLEPGDDGFEGSLEKKNKK